MPERVGFAMKDGGSLENGWERSGDILSRDGFRGHGARKTEKNGQISRCPVPVNQSQSCANDVLGAMIRKFFKAYTRLLSHWRHANK